MLHECVFFTELQVSSMTGDSFLECPEKKKFSLFRLGPNALKRLWCNADIQMVSALSSVVHVHWKIFVL